MGSSEYPLKRICNFKGLSVRSSIGYPSAQGWSQGNLLQLLITNGRSDIRSVDLEERALRVISIMREIPELSHLTFTSQSKRTPKNSARDVEGGDILPPWDMPLEEGNMATIRERHEQGAFGSSQHRTKPPPPDRGMVQIRGSCTIPRVLARTSSPRLRSWVRVPFARGALAG